MKKELIAIATVTVILLTGCERNDNQQPINVSYGDMFKSSDSAVTENQSEIIFSEVVTSNDMPVITDSPLASEIKAEEKSSETTSQDDVSNEVSATENASLPSQEEYYDFTSDKNMLAAESISDNSVENQQTAPATQANESTTQSNALPRIGVPTDNQEIANAPIDEVCYLPYKVTDPKKDEAFSHGYRVIFRTETDTYLLGNYPYKFCKWDDITLVCQEIESLLETECQMVGVLSQSDLELLSKAGIYIPGQFEMWTSTPVTEVSTKVYFRNSNGSFLASKDKSKESGVCALIRVSTVQNDEALLSTALPTYEAIKAQFEAEEEQYILET